MEFSFKRFFALMRRYFYSYQCMICLILILCFLFGIYMGWQDDDDHDGLVILVTMLLYMVTALSFFPELMMRKERKNFLLLPATALEKYMCSLFISGVCVPFFVGIITQTGIYIGYQHNVHNLETFNVLSDWFWKNPERTLLTCGVCVSIMCYLSVCVPLGGVLFLYLIGILLFLYEEYEEFVITKITIDNNACADVFQNTMYTFWTWAFAIMIPVFLGLTYLRLKEERA